MTEGYKLEKPTAEMKKKPSGGIVFRAEYFSPNLSQENDIRNAEYEIASRDYDKLDVLYTLIDCCENDIRSTKTFKEV